MEKEHRYGFRVRCVKVPDSYFRFQDGLILGLVEKHLEFRLSINCPIAHDWTKRAESSDHSYAPVFHTTRGHFIDVYDAHSPARR